MKVLIFTNKIFGLIIKQTSNQSYFLLFFLFSCLIFTLLPNYKLLNAVFPSYFLNTGQLCKPPFSHNRSFFCPFFSPVFHLYLLLLLGMLKRSIALKKLLLGEQKYFEKVQIVKEQTYNLTVWPCLEMCRGRVSS